MSFLLLRNPLNSYRMPSEDSTFGSLSSLNSAGDYFYEEPESDLPGNDTVEVQDDSNGLNHNKKKLRPRQMIGNSTEAKSGANTQRKRQVPNELSKAKRRSTKRGRPTLDAGELSEASQQPEPKRKEERVNELIKKKSVSEVLKILRDRVYRRIKNDEVADRASSMYLMKLVIQNGFLDLLSPIVQSFAKIGERWPARSDLDDIRKKIKQMKDEEREKENQAMEVTDDVMWRLEEIEQKIKSSDEKRQKDSEKANELEKIFTTEGVSVETLREKLSSAFQWLFWEETSANNEPAADEVQASLQTRKHSTVKDMEQLEKKVFDKENNKVNFSDFQGLRDYTGGGNIPEYLKATAKNVEDARGKRTDDAARNILILVSTAVKEMEDLAVDELDCPTLCKWGATFNRAKEMKFEVNFVENLLKKNVYTYFYSRLKAV